MAQDAALYVVLELVIIGEDLLRNRWPLLLSKGLLNLSVRELISFFGKLSLQLLYFCLFFVQSFSLLLQLSTLLGEMAQCLIDLLAVD